MAETSSNNCQQQFNNCQGQFNNGKINVYVLLDNGIQQYRFNVINRIKYYFIAEICKIEKNKLNFQ